MLSTHILDTSMGIPAEGVRVLWEKVSEQGEWVVMGDEHTDHDGRISFGQEIKAGSYRLSFFVENYFLKQKRDSIFSVIPVVFKIYEYGLKKKYHIPLLLNPFGYSTYRGS